MLLPCCKRIIEHLLDLGAGVELGKPVIIAAGRNAVGEKNIQQVMFWVHPHHCAGKTGVAKT